MTELDNQATVSPEIRPSEANEANPAAPLNARGLLRSTLTVMGGFIATKIITIGQVFIITDRFGARSDYDTFVQADTVPTQLARFLAIGVIAAAFIPIFSGLLNQNNREGAWRLASQVFNNLLLITVVLSLIVGLAAPLIVEHVIAPGFNETETSQTVDLLRILMINIVVFALSSLLMGVLMGHNHFFLPMLAPIFQDLGLLFGAIVFVKPFGIYGLAWGLVLGAFLHFAIQIPGLYLYKAKWTPSLGWNDPNFRQVLRLIIPRTLSSAVFAINFVVFSNLNSRLGEGVPSAFSWGLRLMDIPEALIGTALGFAIFPTLSALTEQGRFEDRNRRVSEAVRFVVVATLPAMAGLLFLGRPALDILFVEKNEAALVYATLQVFAFAMIFQAVHEIIARAFYAQKDTFTPLMASFAGMLGAIAVMLVGYAIYQNVDGIPLAGPLGAGIPALGYLAAFAIDVSILIVILRRRWGDLGTGRILQAAGRALAATILMSIVIVMVDVLLVEFVFPERGRVAGIIRAGVGSVVGLVAFGIGAWVFKLEEIKQLPRMVRQYRGESDPETASN